MLKFESHRNNESLSCAASRRADNGAFRRPLGNQVHAEPSAQVLICDDEARLGDLTAGLLEECGFPATFVAEGREALDYLHSHPKTGVLLLDVNLASGMSTAELLALLLREGRAVRVVLTSGSALQDLEPTLAQHALVVGYLEKPYTEEALTAAVIAATT